MAGDVGGGEGKVGGVGEANGGADGAIVAVDTREARGSTADGVTELGSIECPERGGKMQRDAASSDTGRQQQMVCASKCCGPCLGR